MGRLDEAEPYLRRSLEGLQRTIDPLHPNLIRSTSNMGLLLRDLERLDEAEPYLRQAVSGFQTVFVDAHHPETLNAMSNLANLLRRLHQYEEAAAIGSEVLRLSRESMPADHIHLGYSLTHHARTLLEMKRFSEAEV